MVSASLNKTFLAHSLITTVKLEVNEYFINKGTGVIVFSRKEGNVLFNDALNTFYLQLYGVRHMVKDH